MYPYCFPKWQQLQKLSHQVAGARKWSWAVWLGYYGTLYSKSRYSKKYLYTSKGKSPVAMSTYIVTTFPWTGWLYYKELLLHFIILKATGDWLATVAVHVYYIFFKYCDVLNQSHKVPHKNPVLQPYSLGTTHIHPYTQISVNLHIQKHWSKHVAPIWSCLLTVPLLFYRSTWL